LATARRVDPNAASLVDPNLVGEAFRLRLTIERRRALLASAFPVPHLPASVVKAEPAVVDHLVLLLVVERSSEIS
jgi:hypothetical protein